MVSGALVYALGILRAFAWGFQHERLLAASRGPCVWGGAWLGQQLHRALELYGRPLRARIKKKMNY